MTVLALATIALFFALTTSSGAFQGGNEFQLWSGSAVVDTGTDTASIPVVISPGATAASAVRATIGFDPDLIDFTSCTPSTTWVSCTETSPGLVVFEAVTSTSWTAPTELLTVNVTTSDVLDATPLTLTIEQGLAESTAQLAGNSISGLVGPQFAGDVNCSVAIDITDALVIAQFSASIRQDSGACPLSDNTVSINADAGDVNNDNRTDVVDALLIAQCAVGIPNVFCG